MNDLINENKKSIYIGILSSAIFLYFFQPILDFVGSKLLILMENTASKFSDDFYSKIAHLELMDFSFYWIALIFISIGFSFGLIGVSGYIRLIKKKSQPKEKTAHEDSLLKKVVSYAFCLLVFVFSLLFISTKFYQLSLISSFKQHVRILAPYISDQEEEVIYANWSLMKNAGDYRNIYISLSETAQNNKVKLPNNKIYSLTTF
jgi:hypothetical protein